LLNIEISLSNIRIINSPAYLGVLRGELARKKDGIAFRKFLKEPLRGSKVLLCGCGEHPSTLGYRLNLLFSSTGHQIF